MNRLVISLLRNWPCLLCALVVALCAMPAAAETSDVWTVYDGGGGIVERYVQLEDPAEADLFVTPGWLGAPLKLGSPLVWMDPDGTISDVFGVSNFNGQVGWMSDPFTNADMLEEFAVLDGSGNVLAFTPDVRPEPPGEYDVSYFIQDPAFLPGYRATFSSVPEPVTMFGVFMGLGSVGMYIRKRIKGQVAA